MSETSPSGIKHQISGFLTSSVKMISNILWTASFLSDKEGSVNWIILVSIPGIEISNLSTISYILSSSAIAVRSASLILLVNSSLSANMKENVYLLSNFSSSVSFSCSLSKWFLVSLRLSSRGSPLPRGLWDLRVSEASLPSTLRRRSSRLRRSSSLRRSLVHWRWVWSRWSPIAISNSIVVIVIIIRLFLMSRRSKCLWH